MVCVKAVGGDEDFIDKILSQRATPVSAMFHLTIESSVELTEIK